MRPIPSTAPAPPVDAKPSVAADVSEARTIGRWGALAIVMGSMLGIGIFLTPSIVAQQIQSTPLFLAAWATGGAIALCGAVAYAELGALFPRAGGDYVFLREAWGESVAFASGWLLFGGVFVGSIATVAVPIFEYQIPFLLGPWLTDAHHLDTVTSRRFAQAGAIGLVCLLTWINCVGTSAATRLQLVLTGIPTTVLAGGAVWAFATAPHATALPAVRDVVFEGSPLTGFLVATLAIYFAYSGWNAIGYVGGEVRSPERNIPRGLLGGTALITAFYLVLASAFIVVLGIGGLTTTPEAGTATAAALGGASFAWAMNLLITCALAGSLNGTILAGARIARAMATDGVMPSALGRLHSTYRTPTTALIVQGALAALLIVTGTFERLLELTSVAMFVLGGLTVASLFRLRRRSPDLPRPYRATGYPVLPGVYLAFSVIVLLSSVWRVFDPSGEEDLVRRTFPLLGVALFGAALLYHPLKRRVERPTPGPTEEPLPSHSPSSPR